MPRRSKRNNNDGGRESEQQQQSSSVPQVVRDRQRAVAEREAARLARPERSSRPALAHADRKLSAVSSTPFGFFSSSKNSNDSDDDPDNDQDKKTEEWCGPFSVARQMIGKREKAKRKREEELAEKQQKECHPLDGLMDEVNLQQQCKIHPSMKWKSNLSNSTITSTYAKRQRRLDLTKIGKGRIPKLYELAVEFLVDNFDCVTETLGYVDNDIRLAIGKELVGRNKLDANAFETLINPAETIETLEIIDSSSIPQETMASILARTTSLRHLLLTHAGRCFGSKSVKMLLENTGAQLCVLSIAGAYLLQDDDVAKLIEAYDSTLRSIAFQSCSLLGGKFVNAIHSNKNLCGNLVEMSLQDMKFSNDHLNIFANSNDVLKGLKSLTLKSIDVLTDQILSKILEIVHESLEELNVGFNYSLSDVTLSSIRKYNQNLKILVLDGNKEFTAAGLEIFFTHPLQGFPPPPKLKVLKLASIDHEAVTDETLRLVTASSSSSGRHSFGGGGGSGLFEIDVQGSTLVTDQMLEQLVETSARTLVNINVSYCSLISDKGLGYMVSKMGNQLTKLQVWGCAQLTDDFFDGHDRVHDEKLEIIGAWMKKSGTSTLR